MQYLEDRAKKKKIYYKNKSPHDIIKWELLIWKPI